MDLYSNNIDKKNKIYKIEYSILSGSGKKCLASGKNAKDDINTLWFQYYNRYLKLYIYQ